MKITIIFSILFFTSTVQSQVHEWVKSMGDTLASRGEVICVDNSGNVISAGFFLETLDFNPGPGVYNLNTSGWYDIYIQKLDASGNFIWARSIGGTYIDKVYSIDTDAQGNIYTTGQFRDSVDFDPGTGTQYAYTSTYSVFIHKMDASGNLVWVKTFDTVSEYSRSLPYSTSISSSGNIYTTGEFSGTIDFDSGPGVYNVSGNPYGKSIFIHKMDDSGNFIWVKWIGINGYSKGTSSDTDASGNVYLTGYFEDTLDFDPSIDTSYMYSSGESDIFILKLDSSGNFNWVRSFGSAFEDKGISISVDPSGNAYTTGIFHDTVDFDPGTDVDYHTSGNINNIFVQKLNTFGDLIWANSFKGNWSSKDVKSNSLDVFGNIYTIGGFQGVLDFDPGTDATTVDGNSGKDIYVQKMDSSGNFMWVRTFGKLYNSDGQDIYADEFENVYTTGSYRENLDFDPGSDVDTLGEPQLFDIFVHKMSACTPSTSQNSEVITACDSYEWINGVTYTSSKNTGTHLIDISGCDSIVTLDLTILNSTTGIDEITACNTYTWLNGYTYSHSVYGPTHILTNSIGCDSIVTLDLTMNTVDSSFTETGPTTLTANLSGANYQWLDCENGFSPIIGETGQVFEVTETGIYAVEVTGNCIDTSICYGMSVVGLSSLNIKKSIELFPNPTKGEVLVSFNDTQSKSLTLTDAKGLVLRKLNLNHKEIELDLSKYPAGIYLLNIVRVDQNEVIRIVKE